MQNEKQDDYVCSNCRRDIDEGDDFCPHCGAIFAEEVFCDKHPIKEATGVCVVCGVPFNTKELRVMVPCAEVGDAERILGTPASSQHHFEKMKSEPRDQSRSC